MIKRISFLSVGLLAGASLFAGSGSGITKRYNNDRLSVDTNDYNIRMADNLYLDLSYETYLRYDSNSNTASDSKDKLDGVSWMNGIGTSLYWPIQPEVTLYADFTIGYIAEISGDTEDGLYLSTSANAPLGNTFGVDIYLSENMGLSIYDTMQINNSYEGTDGDSGEIKQQFINDLDAQFDWEVTSLINTSQSVGYGIVKSMNSDYEDEDKVIIHYTAQLNFQVNSTTNIGPYFKYEDVDYDQEENNDYETYEVGGQLDKELSETKNLQAHLGWKKVDTDVEIDNPFNNPNNQTGFKNSSSGDNSIVAGATLSSEISEVLQHSITAKYDVVGSDTVTVNTSETLSAQYSLLWDMSSDWSLNYDMYWLHSRDDRGERQGQQNNPNLNPDDIVAETFDLYVFRLGLNQYISDKITLNYGFEASYKDSNVVKQDYERYRATFGFNYNF
ncbi:MAG: hypothetical protein MK193_07410 [Lentisphaeria bacterium]|nr:hypothetical protein [Lentisphaeria bacterium]